MICCDLLEDAQDLIERETELISRRLRDDYFDGSNRTREKRRSVPVRFRWRGGFERTREDVGDGGGDDFRLSGCFLFFISITSFAGFADVRVNKILRGFCRRSRQ